VSHFLVSAFCTFGPVFMMSRRRRAAGSNVLGAGLYWDSRDRQPGWTRLAQPSGAHRALAEQRVERPRDGLLVDLGADPAANESGKRSRSSRISARRRART